jgi:glycosyltransferase involved in cell wall biosynthesis
MLSWLVTALLAIWIVLTVQTVVNLLVFRRLERASESSDSRVSIVIPARNEERYIGKTLDAALAQDYSDLEVIVVDDGSTDATATEIATRASDPRLVSLSSRPLEPGWLGKPNALATGARRATGKWILFMDADVILHPKTLRDAVVACERHGWDHLALLPHFEREGFWEELLMPVIPVVAFIFVPSFLSFVRRARLAAGGGAFGLVRREAYESIGGHDAIRNSVVDDIRLAMELKSAGFVSNARMGLHRLSLRMYHGFDEIVEGFTKNVHTGFGRSTLRPVVFLLLSLWVGVTPFLWPFFHTVPELGASLGLLLFCRALVQIRLGFPLWPIFLSPVTTILALFIAQRSLRMARREGVVRWRGREYRREMTEF